MRFSDRGLALAVRDETARGKWRRRESNPIQGECVESQNPNNTPTEPGHKSNNSGTLEIDTPATPKSEFDSFPTLPEQKRDTITGQIYDHSMARSERDQMRDGTDFPHEYAADRDPELAELVACWEKLPQLIRVSLLAIIRATLGERE